MCTACPPGGGSALVAQGRRPPPPPPHPTPRFSLLLQCDEDAVEELRANGISREDAIQALKACSGIVEEAAVWLLAGGAGSAGGGGSGSGALQGQSPRAVAELVANGIGQADAVKALSACGGSVEDAAVWLLAGGGSGSGSGGALRGADPRAVAELRAYQLSEEDAVAALEACDGDVDQVG